MLTRVCLWYRWWRLRRTMRRLTSILVKMGHLSETTADSLTQFANRYPPLTPPEA